jgi:multicomponent K+:H+ antiporter subunit E
VLNDSLAPADLLVALLVGWLVPWLAAPLKPPGGACAGRWCWRAWSCAWVATSWSRRLQVAGGVLRPARRPPRGAFVTVPLDLRDPHGLAALAIITAVVPGTLWSELAPDRSRVLMHVFDVEDEAAFIAQYKARYELPLKEIFE